MADMTEIGKEDVILAESRQVDMLGLLCIACLRGSGDFKPGCLLIFVSLHTP